MPNKRQEGLKCISVWVDEALCAEVEATGRRFGKTRTDIIREALEGWLRQRRRQGKGTK